MLNILYKINSSLNYGQYKIVDKISKAELQSLQQQFAERNGTTLDKVKLIVVDDKDCVIMAIPKLTKQEKQVIVEKMGYTFKRGI